MTRRGSDQKPFNIVIVGQSGRLQYEALLFAASLRAQSPAFSGKLLVAEPQPGTKWPDDPRMSDDIRAALEELGAEIVPFENRVFGSTYPHGNKIEMLSALPPDEPFVFFDTDTLILDDILQVPFDFERPTASLRRDNSWPKIELYGPGYTEIWASLYTKFGIDFESSLDLSQPDGYWQRYLYFNAGFFFYRCPRVFGQRFLEIAQTIHDDRPQELVCQSLDPWLDQVALPLVIHELGGGRNTLPDGLLDGSVTCHYRVMSLLFARESDRVISVLEAVAAPNKVKKLLKHHEPFKRFIFQGRGARVRGLFDQNDLPRKEQAIRNRIKSAGLWMR